MPGNKILDETPLSSSGPPQAHLALLGENRGSPRNGAALSLGSYVLTPQNMTPFTSAGAHSGKTPLDHTHTYTRTGHTHVHTRPRHQLLVGHKRAGAFCVSLAAARGEGPGDRGGVVPPHAGGRCPFAPAQRPCWPEPVNHAARSFPSYRSYRS